LSFSAELATLALDGRIVDASVVDFEKRYDADQEKYYVYAVRVQRENGIASTVFRRFREFHEFHGKLVAAFPKADVPAFAQKIYVGRSHTRAVSEKRQKALHQYLQDLLAMPAVVRDSDLMYAFLHTLPRDASDLSRQTPFTPVVGWLVGWFKMYFLTIAYARGRRTQLQWPRSNWTTRPTSSG
jgi:phosphatidylinositol-4-phosphate 3-kinase